MRRPASATAARIPPDKLILWSVCALYHRAEQATDKPMKPDFGIKVALAGLHALGCDRSGVDGYWRAMRATHPAGYPAGQAKYVRGTELRKAMEGIMCSLNVGDALFQYEVHEAIHGPGKIAWSQLEILDHLRDEREEQAERRRQRSDCGWL